ncbi:MAG TPA: hypothetical protein VM166_14360 [Gemmatimonadaceae bacterium]|nr:hypothetical protein [Gemmatimonadaceae bacterium]
MIRTTLLRLVNVVAASLLATACVDSVAPSTTPAVSVPSELLAQLQQKGGKCDASKSRKHGCTTSTAQTPAETPKDTTTSSTGTTWVAIPPTLDPSGKKVKGIRWNSGHVEAEVSVTGTIGPAGGSLTIPESDFMIYFPYGAVTVPTTITIVSKESSWIAYDMLPHGLKFAKPVYVTQGLLNTAVYGTPAAYSVFGAYLSSGNETIAADDGAIATETTYSFVFSQGSVRVATWSVWLINHFSRYILASG